jgi:predicted ATP-dependent endonuclease of OLD family
MIGMVYSPEIILESGLKNDINSLSRYLFMKSSKRNDIESLGLGHLNMIYMALKIVEYEFNKTRELINIMIIEEPEAHIHTHIQKTLFENLKVAKDYTQIIATTHSTHLSEVSAIKNINIMKSIKDVSYAMQPSVGLDDFGENNLKLNKLLKLSECIERYLDVKRTVLLFSKGTILVEGDGEEILIPNMVRYAFGITLDEIGIGLINVGSTAFEYIACLFGEERINRCCAIVTDEDVQAVTEKSSFYSKKAEDRGKNRKKKLDSLFETNKWVKNFYAPHTLEIDFVDIEDNRRFVEEIIDLNYTRSETIDMHKNAINGASLDRANTVLTLARDLGKGWYSTILSEKLNIRVVIPDYILDAIAFASSEIITTEIILKMIEYSLKGYERTDEINTFLNSLHKAKKIAEKEKIAAEFRVAYEENIVSKFLNKREQYRTE